MEKLFNVSFASRLRLPLLLLLCLGAAAAQSRQTIHHTPATDEQTQPPVLLAADDTAAPAPEECAGKIERTISVAMIVDAKGQPHQLFLLSPQGNDLDLLALQIAARNRFLPGRKDGKPAPVALVDTIHLPACPVPGLTTADGKTKYTLLAGVRQTVSVPQATKKEDAQASPPPQP